jgi:hypothetical protein
VGHSYGLSVSSSAAFVGEGLETEKGERSCCCVRSLEFDYDQGVTDDRDIDIGKPLRNCTEMVCANALEMFYA